MATDFHMQSVLPSKRLLKVLEIGTHTEMHGLVAWGSNHTFLVTVSEGDDDILAIYKPRSGERRLWDFPEGTLCLREIAAFLISEALDWKIVPATALGTGHYGPGSVQHFVPHDPDQNYFTLGQEYSPQLRRIALFDCIINNADRKGGHCLLDPHGKIWSIDHGVCLHHLAKVRTVIWDYAGESIPDNLIHETRGLLEQLQQDDLLEQLGRLLTYSEINALRQRTEQIIHTGVFPQPGPGRNHPWPPV